MSIRKLSIGASALVIALGLSTALETGPAFAVAKVQPGTLSCTTVTGKITFKPALNNTGGKPEVATINTTVKGCTPSGGGLTPTKGIATSKISLPSNTCTALASPPPGFTIKITTKWSPTLKIKPSTVTYSGFTPILSPDIGFRLGGSGTSGTGSYMGTDGGASSTATAISNQTETQVLNACGSTTGLATLKIVSGTSDLG